MAEVDISKVISIIMENPKLLDEIKSLAASDKIENTAAEELTEPTEVHIPTAIPEPQRRSKRTELLDALKPYISDERKKAIESFITIAEILEVMRGK